MHFVCKTCIYVYKKMLQNRNMSIKLINNFVDEKVVWVQFAIYIYLHNYISLKNETSTLLTTVLVIKLDIITFQRIFFLSIAMALTFIGRMVKSMIKSIVVVLCFIWKIMYVIAHKYFVVTPLSLTKNCFQRYWFWFHFVLYNFK